MVCIRLTGTNIWIVSRSESIETSASLFKRQTFILFVFKATTWFGEKCGLWARSFQIKRSALDSISHTLIVRHGQSVIFLSPRELVFLPDFIAMG